MKQLDVESGFMNDLKAMAMTMCVMMGKRITYILYACVEHREEEQQRSTEMSKIKSDRRSQETITVNR